MRSFHFDYDDRTFTALFKDGFIQYDRNELTSYFGLEKDQSTLKVTSAQAKTLLPPEKMDLFKALHETAQNTLFEIIRFDNETD